MCKIKYRLYSAVFNFAKCRQGVTSIEYAVLAVGVAAILVIVFNTNSGGFYEAMKAAETALVNALSNDP